jgi:hypothetical protein
MGHTLLSIAAMLLLAFTSFNFNASVLETASFEVENKVALTAFSLADDLIEEIKQKAFDEKTVDFQAIAVNQLTSPTYIGKESGENWPDFNDIDDYNNYSKPVSLPHAEGYLVISVVNYVNSEGSDITTQSFFKKVAVTVSSEYLKRPIVISFIFSLHSKN